MVMWGVKPLDESTYICSEAPEISDVCFIVGQNLKFDLCYSLKHDVLSISKLADIKVWDTQLAEYLLSGQQALYASLDELVVRYGGTVKDSAVTEFFKAGKGADEIPESMLIPYLRDDLENTQLVYQKQRALATTYNMLPLIESQMDALKATTIMEFNGMRIDSDYIDKKIEELSKELEIVESHIESLVKATTHLPSEWSYKSNKDLSLFFFGGRYKERTREEVGVYKTSGKPKFKWVETVHTRSPLYDHATMKAEPTAYGFTVDEKVLKNLKLHASAMANNVIKARTISKHLNTYFVNLRDLLFPGDLVHPSLNHTATKTGRLSCTKPNIQNQTEEGGIKAAYISRWKERGWLVEFDYSQLEMVALAVVSGDTQLQEDISSGKDMHTELYKDMYSTTPSKEERKWFKRLSFGLVYGAGYKTLAENAGCDEADAKRFIKVFYTRYPAVKSWHDSQSDAAKRNRIVSKEHDPVTHMPVGKYVQHTLTGRRYVYREYYNDWKKEMSFSPTELKNYCVQGFATGDIVPHMVGYIVRHLSKSDLRSTALPIMTVHDSILFDVHESTLDKFVSLCYTALNRTTEVVNKHFNIDIPIQLQVGCKVGRNWQEMEDRVFA